MAYIKEILLKTSFSKFILQDNGTEFKSDQLMSVFHTLGIKHIYIQWPPFTLNVTDQVCVYFYNFNHKNFYQGMQKFTYSIMNMLRQQNRLKWILYIISLGFLVFYFITLWESLGGNWLVHRL